VKSDGAAVKGTPHYPRESSAFGKFRLAPATLLGSALSPRLPFRNLFPLLPPSSPSPVTCPIPRNLTHWPESWALCEKYPARSRDYLDGLFPTTPFFISSTLPTKWCGLPFLRFHLKIPSVKIFRVSVLLHTQKSAYRKVDRLNLCHPQNF